MKHDSTINAVEVRALKSKAGVILIDQLINSVVRERCGVEEDVVAKRREMNA